MPFGQRYPRLTEEHCEKCESSTWLGEWTFRRSANSGSVEVHEAECGHEVRRRLMITAPDGEATETFV